MNKTIYLFLVVIGLLVLSTCMLFYNSNSTIMNHTDNIIFKKTKLTYTYSKRNRNRNIIDESMLTTIDRENHRNLQIEKYNNKKITPITSVSNAHNVSYLNSNLSLMSNSTMPRITLNGNNIHQSYQRFIADNSVSIVANEVHNYQNLNIRQSHVHSHGLESGVISTGGFMATASNCPHDDISITIEGLKCNICGATAKLEGVGDGSGSVNGGDNGGIKWTPIGDILFPMLLMALGYVVMMFVRKK